MPICNGSDKWKADGMDNIRNAGIQASNIERVRGTKDGSQPISVAGSARSASSARGVGQSWHGPIAQGVIAAPNTLAAHRNAQITRREKRLAPGRASAVAT